jgi:predicted KAP-like P-loop ATPase
LAFDEGVVGRALEKVGGSDFLDKIINVPLAAPTITSVQVQRLVLKRLNQFAEAHQDYSWEDNKRAIAVVDFVTKAFKTIRHLERIVNALNFNAELLKSDVDYADLISIVALRATIPEAYKFIRDNRNVLLHTTESLIDRERANKEAKTAIEAFFVTQSARETLSDLFAVMFPRFGEIMNRRGRDDGDEHSWNRERRICSTKSFDSYFTFDAPEGDIDAGQMRRILESLTEESLTFALRSLISEGNDKAIAFLERLSDHVDEPAVVSNAGSVVKVLLNLGDVFPVDLRGFPFKLDGHTLVMQLVYQITKRVATEQERFEILRDAITSATESLYAPVTTISVEDQGHSRFEDAKRVRDPSRSDELVTDAHLDELEQLMRAQIEVWAADGRLAEHASLPYILFRWLNWGDQETVARYILQELDDRNFVRLVVLMGRNQAQHHFGTGPTLVGSPISKLANIAQINSRLQNILGGSARDLVPRDLLSDADALALAASIPQ